MSKIRLIGSCEIAINTMLRRLSKLDGKNKLALESEFREWICAIESSDRNYDILYMKKIK